MHIQLSMDVAHDLIQIERLRGARILGIALSLPVSGAVPGWVSSLSPAFVEGDPHASARLVRESLMPHEPVRRRLHVKLWKSPLGVFHIAFCRLSKCVDVHN